MNDCQQFVYDKESITDLWIANCVIQLTTDLCQFQTALANKDADIEQLKSDHATVQAEQEDLLMMLSDQDSKLKVYKKKLRIFGEANLSPDEAEDDELSDWKSWQAFFDCFYTNHVLWYIYLFHSPLFTMTINELIWTFWS